MSEVAPATLRVHRLTPLPDAFWRGVRETPWRYDLFQLLRRIDARGGERYPLGRAPLPKFEPLRIGQQPSMGFAPSTVAEVRQREENGLHEVSILSFGLFGPNGPLPVHMTEYARERIHHHQDHSLSAFADLFHHRLTLLFYRARADAQPAVSLDRDDNRRFEGYLASLIGMGQPAQMSKGSLSAHARFTHAGHLTRHGRDPEGWRKSCATISTCRSGWWPTSRSGCRSQRGSRHSWVRGVACRAWESPLFSALRYATCSINSGSRLAR